MPMPMPMPMPGLSGCAFSQAPTGRQINDTFGHAAGDRALQLVADCLCSLVRESDRVCRIGGDEFVVLLGEVKNAADARAVAAKVNTALAACSLAENPQLPLKASIGISVYPEDGEDAKTLLAFADAAMYVAKRGGRGQATLPRDASRVPAPPSAGACQSRQHSGTRPTRVEQERRQQEVRDANESLILAALGAQELLAAAQEARRRQAELLVMVANELSDPLAPIRQAAKSLGLAGAEAALLPRIQRVIDEQADRLARMVRDPALPAPRPR